MKALVFHLMRWRARLWDAAGRCICCGVGGSYIPDNVCFTCYYRWTFDGWRPWWLNYAAQPKGSLPTGETK